MTGKSFLAALVFALLLPSFAVADYYYAVATGEKEFRSREDRDYRATRAAMGRCASEFDPLLCRIIRLERVRGRWEALVLGYRGFYGADRDRQRRADRVALSACRSLEAVRNCRLVGKESPETPPDRDPSPGLENLLDELLNPWR